MRNESEAAYLDLWESVYRHHDPDNCGGENCVLHNPSDHHMRGWPLHYRSDRVIFERTCPHGVGHPDPDQFDFWAQTNQEWQAVHGCDFCCHNPSLEDK